MLTIDDGMLSVIISLTSLVSKSIFSSIMWRLKKNFSCRTSMHLGHPMENG